MVVGLVRINRDCRRKDGNRMGEWKMAWLNGIRRNSVAIDDGQEG